MYAIIQTGGKQYRVEVGQNLEVDRLPLSKGSQVELDQVLMVSDGDKTLVGGPTVEGAKVLATVVGERKGKKVIVFKYKPKVRYRKKTGHRQLYTQLAVKNIVLSEA